MALALVAPAGAGFWERHPRSQVSLRAWYSVVSKAAWETPSDVGIVLNSADFVRDNRVVFNVGGNEFRIVAHVSYRYRHVLIKFVGTHAEYDKVDAGTV